METPVIARCWNNEQISEGETGWIVPYEGYKEISTKVLELYDSPKIKNIGINAYRIIQEKYTTKHMIDNYLEFYKEICEDFKLINNDTKSPLISIITPSYNTAAFIEETIFKVVSGLSKY